jgi:hypothetical protein
VLIASKSEYGLTQVNVSTEAEMITGSIKLGNKQLMITSYYRPLHKPKLLMKQYIYIYIYNINIEKFVTQ